MEHSGWLSVLPPVVAIGLAIKTRQVYLALGLFVLLGWTIIESFNPLRGVIRSTEALVAVLTDADNVYLLLFTALIGGLISFTQFSGGVQGFVRRVERLGLGERPRRLQLFTAMLSCCIFLESWFGLLVCGSIARPLFDRARISREKLSYILDATCAPKCILIPINAWGAYVVGLLRTQGFEQPVAVFAASLPFLFYAQAALVVVLLVMISGRDIGPMRAAERRVRERGELLRPGAEPMLSEDLTAMAPKEGVPPRAVNMLLPVAIMIAVVPVVMYFTGGGDIRAGSGSKSLFWAAASGLAVATVVYMAQRLASFKELTDALFKGVQGLIPLMLVLVLAFAIGKTTKALGTGVFLAQAAQATLPHVVIPAVIFALACVIAFSTGTSWGTFGIMIPIITPMIRILGLHPQLTIGAALGGGIFGDHCSPISDSTIVSSMASATDHIDHVRTQLPYALISAGIALAASLALAAAL